jgi:hypothetical protein
MPYLCLACGEVYDKSVEKIVTDVKTDRGYEPTIFCPKLSCNVGEVVEIDELYIPVIRLLNEKGYMTKYCCSGHAYGRIPDTYIVFHEMVKELPNLPEGSHMQNDGSIRIYYNYPDESNEIELYHLILENAQKVLKWAIELPERPKLI